MGKHHPVQLLLVAAAAVAAAAPSVQKTAAEWENTMVVEVVVVRNKGQKYYSLARSPLRLPGSADWFRDLFLHDVYTQSQSWSHLLTHSLIGSIRNKSVNHEKTVATKPVNQEMPSSFWPLSSRLFPSIYYI